MAKKYGLMIPKKNLSAPKAINVFGDSNDSDEDEGTDWVKKALKAENEKNKTKKKTQNDLKKALEMDPTIFKYDEIYDEMERTKEEEKAAQKVERKPKYMEKLLKSADQRKKEQELRKDRMIQKEVEAEEAMYGDKERFITSGYKKKLEEMKQFEEEQNKKDSLDEMVDITKQKDMSGFYRHIYRQTVERNEADLGIQKNEKTQSKDPSKISSNIDEDDPIASSSSSESENDSIKNAPIKDTVKKFKKDRQYRKRANEKSESEEEDLSTQEKEINNTEEKSNAKDQLPESENKENSETLIKKSKLSDNSESESKENLNVKKDEAKESTSKDSLVSEKVKKTSEPKLEKKINIWEKRTVGPVFDDLLQKYLIRKNERDNELYL